LFGRVGDWNRIEAGKLGLEVAKDEEGSGNEWGFGKAKLVM
jgi:hypothetical protein